MNYNALTKRHFETTAATGVLTGPDTRRGAAGSQAQGAWVQFDVRIDGGRLREVRFQAFGCPHVIAVADWIAQSAVGTEVSPALPETLAALQARFAVPTEKLGKLLLIEDAWMAAISPPYRP